MLSFQVGCLSDSQITLREAGYSVMMILSILWRHIPRQVLGSYSWSFTNVVTILLLIFITEMLFICSLYSYFPRIKKKIVILSL